MKRASLALCSLVAVLTLPAYADNSKAAAGAANAPSASGSAPVPSARPGAERPLVAEVLILHATNEQKGIDPRIGKLPELGKLPFSNYDSYQVLDRARLPLKKDAPQNVKLPNGRTLQVRLLDELGPDSVRLSASINRPSGKEFLPLLE
ncbi:MAG TPA: hypothetical protein VJV79_37330, partial [Polyangiaceae bacterium]|nr:hypothetical protein [Polyangiaceae bacterium]